MQPGLTVAITAGDDTLRLDELRIGAPTHVIMTMIDIHFFDHESFGQDYPEGWEQELESKWPVSGLEVRRSPDLVFPEIILPPDCGADRPPTRHTRATFDDGEQSTAGQWMNALRAAAGRRGRWSLYYVNIYGVPSGGQAGGFGGVGNGQRLGILHHELGHALSLPHWGDNADYPTAAPCTASRRPRSTTTCT